MQELVSIIIPIYNGSMYIKDIVKAVKEQTYTLLEVIIVDDGSLDNSLDLCHKYMNSDKRFRIFSKENGGASSARNYGLKKATGKYVSFIDVDDYIFPDYIKYLYKLLTKVNADMSCCGYYKMWDTELMPLFANKGKIQIFNRNEAICNFLYRKAITVYPVLKLYKKSVLESIEFPEGIAYGEDAIFTYYALQRCNKVIYGDRVLYIYYQHNTSATHAADYHKFQEAWEKQKKFVLDHAKESNSDDIINAAYSRMFILSSDYCCRVWKKKDATGFKNMLINFLKRTDSKVLKDKRSKKSNRFLALLSCMNTSLMIHSCMLFVFVKEKFKFEIRHSL